MAKERQLVNMFGLTLAVVALSAVLPLALGASFTPSGGLGTNSAPPVYHPMSDFDRQSLVRLSSLLWKYHYLLTALLCSQSLALSQEYIELDLYHHGLAMFSEGDFDAAGLNADDRYLIQFMADQEVAHANLITNILGRKTHPCPLRISRR